MNFTCLYIDSPLAVEPYSRDCPSPIGAIVGSVAAAVVVLVIVQLVVVKMLVRYIWL